MTIDNPYSNIKVNPKAQLTPAQWALFNRMKTRGHFLSNADKVLIQACLDQGIFIKTVWPPKPGGLGKPIRKKVGVGVRTRPDVITTTDQIQKPFSFTITYGNGTAKTVSSSSPCMSEYKFDQKVMTYKPILDAKRFTGIQPFLWLRPQPYTRYIKQKKIISHKVVKTSSPTLKFDVHAGTMNSVVTGASWNQVMVPSSVRSEAILKLHSKVADTKVDVMTFAAEAKSSYSMLVDAMADLVHMYKSVRRGNLREANRIMRSRGHARPRKVSKRPDERWLQYQYGWAPLIGDITTAISAFADKTEVPHIFAANVVSHFEPLPYNDSVKTIAAMGEYRLKCYYALKPSDSARTRAQWNLGSNPLLTAWELVPYSFVVDWFIPIGDLVAQLSSTDGLYFISGTESTKVSFTADLISTQRFSLSGQWVDVERKIREDSTYYKRTVLAKTPVTWFPPLTGNATLRRLFSGLSLLTVRLKK